MEADGAGVPALPSPGVTGTERIGEPAQTPGRCPAPRYWGEEMVEREDTGGGPPKNNGVLCLPYRKKGTPQVPAPWNRTGLADRPGKGLPGTPAPHNHPPDPNRVPDPGQQGDRGLGTPERGDSFLNRIGAAKLPAPPSQWGDETTQNGVGPTELSLWGQGDSEPAPRRDGSPSGIGASELSCWDGGKSETPDPPACSPDGIGATELSCWGGIPAYRPGGRPHSTGAAELSRSAAEEEEKDPALLSMFQAVAGSSLAVRSQQKDEPDFTPAQKLGILRELYHTKPLVFLERFRTALRAEHLPCFHHLAGSYEAEFYCAEVRRAGLGKSRRTRVRNKRYAALQQLIKGGEYFSDEQMRSREPLLYEQYIGQYLSDEELQDRAARQTDIACSLSGVLLDSYQEQVIQWRLHRQQEQEEACTEEDEDEEEEEGWYACPGRGGNPGFSGRDGGLVGQSR
uniref:Coiled-coil domain containing 97 n=1 Tax=Sphenodon punctatus TaxID=8508 RepID=A0A8D0H526_SPHPU